MVELIRNERNTKGECWCCCRFVLSMFDLTLLVGVKEGLWIAISDQFIFSCFNGLLLMVQLTSTTSCMLTHHGLCHVNVRAAWNGYLGFFFFPWLPRMAEALQSKPQGKKELVERYSVDLALGVRGSFLITRGVQWLVEK